MTLIFVIFKSIKNKQKFVLKYLHSKEFLLV